MVVLWWVFTAVLLSSLGPVVLLEQKKVDTEGLISLRNSPAL